jgi:hypothetical protein
VLSDLEPYISEQDFKHLSEWVGPNDPIFIWGAHHGSLKELRRVRPGEYVVDVKNREIVQIFKYVGYIETQDIRLQSFVGWDAELDPKRRRPYKYVFFLISPRKSRYVDKVYYQKAFGLLENPQWLVGQTYFDDYEVGEALVRTQASSVEGLLGLVRE